MPVPLPAGGCREHHGLLAGQREVAPAPLADDDPPAVEQTGAGDLTRLREPRVAVQWSLPARTQNQSHGHDDEGQTEGDHG